VAQFKCGDLSTYNAPRPGRPKTVTTPEINDQIQELILEDRRISAKSIAQQLGISRERVGSIIHENLDMRKLSAKWVPKCLNADNKRQRCQSSEQIWNFFGAIQMISCRGWWPWMKPGYITMTRRQRNIPWSGGIAAHPAPKKIPSGKIRWKISRLDFWGIKTASSILFIFQRAKLSTRNITHLCWCNWRTLWRKNATEISPRVSCSCTTMPRLTGHLQLRSKWPAFACSFLITHPILRFWPSRTTTCSLNWKSIEMSPFFVRRGCHCCRGDLVVWTTFWIFFFLSGLQRLEHRAKKCVELRWEYVE